MRHVAIQRVAAAERRIRQFERNDSTNHSYREFLRFFDGVEPITAHHVTVGAYFAYGWMPRILAKFEVAKLDEIVAIVNNAKNGAFPTGKQLTCLICSINNSLVGPSKLLHFVNPKKVAIWDSRVFRFMEGRSPYYHDMTSVQNYLDYHRNLRELVNDQQFTDVHSSLNNKIGYAVSPMRACEYIMYLNGNGND